MVGALDFTNVVGIEGKGGNEMRPYGLFCAVVLPVPAVVVFDGGEDAVVVCKVAESMAPVVKATLVMVLESLKEGAVAAAAAGAEAAAGGEDDDTDDEDNDNDSDDDEGEEAIEAKNDEMDAPILDGLRGDHGGCAVGCGCGFPPPPSLSAGVADMLLDRVKGKDRASIAPAPPPPTVVGIGMADVEAERGGTGGG